MMTPLQLMKDTAPLTPVLLPPALPSAALATTARWR
jgi:hypothetical protein